MTPNIVVVGRLNMDIVLKVEELPKEGHTLIGATMLGCIASTKSSSHYSNKI